MIEEKGAVFVMAGQGFDHIEDFILKTVIGHGIRILDSDRILVKAVAVELLSFETQSLHVIAGAFI